MGFFSDRETLELLIVCSCRNLSNCSKVSVYGTLPSVLHFGYFTCKFLTVPTLFSSACHIISPCADYRTFILFLCIFIYLFFGLFFLSILLVELSHSSSVIVTQSPFNVSPSFQSGRTTPVFCFL